MTRNYSSTAQATTLTADASDTDSTLLVAATDGFPAAPFLLCLDMGTASQEIVLVTTVASLSLTVVRGYDSTTAVAHTAGATVTHTHSAIDFRDSRAHENATSDVHGVTGSLVGTGSAQALTNKDLSSSTNTFPASLATLTGAQTLTGKTLPDPVLTFTKQNLASWTQIATTAGNSITSLAFYDLGYLALMVGDIRVSNVSQGGGIFKVLTPTGLLPAVAVTFPVTMDYAQTNYSYSTVPALSFSTDGTLSSYNFPFASNSTGYRVQFSVLYATA